MPKDGKCSGRDTANHDVHKNHNFSELKNRVTHLIARAAEQAWMLKIPSQRFSFSHLKNRGIEGG